MREYRDWVLKLENKCVILGKNILGDTRLAAFKTYRCAFCNFKRGLCTARETRRKSEREGERGGEDSIFSGFARRVRGVDSNGFQEAIF